MAYTIAKDLMTVIYTSNPMPSVTQCFTGNELYLSERVLCDRQCMTNTEETASASGFGYAGRDPPYRYLAEQCNGPWYCAAPMATCPGPIQSTMRSDRVTPKAPTSAATSCCSRSPRAAWVRSGWQSSASRSSAAWR